MPLIRTDDVGPYCFVDGMLARPVSFTNLHVGKSYPGHRSQSLLVFLHDEVWVRIEIARADYNKYSAADHAKAYLAARKDILQSYGHVYWS